jgi:hypothetical protein
MRASVPEGKRIGGRQLTPPDTKLLAKIRGLSADGHSMRQIAKILDLGRDKVRRLASDKDLREKGRNVLNVAMAAVKAEGRDGSMART